MVLDLLTNSNLNFRQGILQELLIVTMSSTFIHSSSRFANDQSHYPPQIIQPVSQQIADATRPLSGSILCIRSAADHAPDTVIGLHWI